MSSACSAAASGPGPTSTWPSSSATTSCQRWCRPSGVPWPSSRACSRKSPGLVRATSPRPPSTTRPSSRRTTSQAVRSLFAVVERYPELRSQQNVMALQEEIERLETLIARRRELFNEQVYQYNATIQQLPAVRPAAGLRLEGGRLLQRRAGRSGAAQRCGRVAVERSVARKGAAPSSGHGGSREARRARAAAHVGGAGGHGSRAANGAPWPRPQPDRGCSSHRSFRIDVEPHRARRGAGIASRRTGTRPRRRWPGSSRSCLPRWPATP